MIVCAAGIPEGSLKISPGRPNQNQHLFRASEITMAAAATNTATKLTEASNQDLQALLRYHKLLIGRRAS
jgi:hypothetical protein